MILGGGGTIYYEQKHKTARLLVMLDMEHLKQSMNCPFTFQHKHRYIKKQELLWCAGRDRVPGQNRTKAGMFSDFILKYICFDEAKKQGC